MLEDFDLNLVGKNNFNEYVYATEEILDILGEGRVLNSQKIRNEYKSEIIRVSEESVDKILQESYESGIEIEHEDARDLIACFKKTIANCNASDGNFEPYNPSEDLIVEVMLNLLKDNKEVEEIEEATISIGEGNLKFALLFNDTNDIYNTASTITELINKQISGECNVNTLTTLQEENKKVMEKRYNYYG